MKFFITAILIIIGLRLLFRLIVPLVFRQVVKKAVYQQNPNSSNSRKVGEVRIETKKKPNPDNNVEDVDFEEVK